MKKKIGTFSVRKCAFEKWILENGGNKSESLTYLEQLPEQPFVFPDS